MAALLTARTLIALAALVAVAAVCAALGSWQIDRAAESRSLGARFAAGAARPLERAPAELTEALRFASLRVEGRYAGERQFLLDYQVHDGMAGYDVLTPFYVRGREQVLLVNRGWVPASPDRRVLPKIDVDAEERSVTGRIERLPRPGLRLGKPSPPADDAPPVEVLLYPTIDEIAARLGEPLLDYVLLLDPAAADGFVRDWRAPGLPVERHLAYAGQWFLFAAGAVAAAVALAIREVRGARRPTDA